MFNILFASIATILCLYLWSLIYKRKFSSLEKIPGPATLPFFGNALDFGFNPVDKLSNLHRICKSFGPLSKVWIGPKNVYLVVTDPEFIEKILSSPKYIRKSVDYDFARPWLGNGLLLSSGSYWQKRRRMITPAFHFKILDDFILTFNSESRKLIANLSEAVGKQEFDVYPNITACSLDIICETAMGTSVNAQDNSSDNEYVHAVKTVLNVILGRIFSPWEQFDALFYFSPKYKTHTEALKVIHGFTRSVIKTRREQLTTNIIEENTQKTDDVGIRRKMVFLDILLSANIDGQALSDEDIREEVDTSLFEGHDTTASAIAFAMYELARNPDIQDKLFLELRELCNDDKNHQFSMQDLNQMKYMELVLKETLRLYPPVPFFGRVLEEDFHFKGTKFPKDLRIAIFPYSMHRRPDLFPEPNKFIPERFISTDTNINPFAFMPFSAGPRNCIDLESYKD